MLNTKDDPIPYIDKLSQFFDNAVTLASDDDLFAQGYLRGHVDLAIGQLQVMAEPFGIEDIQQAVTSSLQQAITQGELSEADKALVLGLWQQLN